MAESAKKFRTKTTTIRLTREEVKAVHAAAGAQGMGPSTFARLATLRAAGRAAPPGRRKRTDLAISLADALGSLNRMGISLDQLARQAKEGQIVSAADFHELRLAIEQLTRAVLVLGDR